MINTSFHDLNIRFAFNAAKRVSVYRAIATLMKSGIPLHDIFIELINVYSDGKYKHEGEGKHKLKHLMARAIATLMKRGIPLYDKFIELINIYREWEGKHKLKHPVAIIMERILSDMEEGTRSIGDLFRPWIPEHEALILQAADKIGQDALPAVLDDLIYSIQIRKDITKILLKAVFYPLILTLCGVAVLMIYAIDVIPKISLISHPDSWPTSSRILYSLSNFVNEYIYLVCFGGFSLYIAFFVSLPLWTKRLAKARIVADRYPPYSLYKMLNGCSFMLSLSVMIKSGMSMNDALGEMEKIATPWLKARVQGALYNVARGKGLGESLRLSGYEFPSKEAYHFISLLSKSSDGLANSMYVFSKDWMKDSISSLETMATVILWSGIVLIGALVMLISLGQHGMTSGLVG